MSGPIRTTFLLGLSVALLPLSSGCQWLQKKDDVPYTSDLTPAESVQVEEDEMVDYVGRAREEEQGMSSSRPSDRLFFTDPRSHSINDNFVR